MNHVNAQRYAVVAKQLLEGARTLMEAQIQKGEIVRLPALLLTGQGLELIIKGCLTLNGEAPPRGRKGHQILELWQSAACEPLRGIVYANAEMELENARLSSPFFGVPGEADGFDALEEISGQIHCLCELHQASPDYPLRYPTESSYRAPRTPFLVGTLWRTSDEMVKNLSAFR
ncbi:hypothetical protein [Qingshengfaniella alkalisoli]|uniref:Uncharacterized protein n=1 Tax=Qingshengfaniella alkalisoli TaxID=2599296 RepID=A0A5B8IWC3_9RHOB|nr:hypothetical protein [Qingshengfaniella alkalisoli]QDY69813.1 hypothetical protein FPZ52_09390 [Qingshengfaniella alkalisoli]